MKHAILALIIAGLSIGPALARHKPLTDHQRIRVLQEMVYELRMAAKLSDSPAFLKHAWPALSEEEKATFTSIAKTWPKTVKVDIVCNDAGCSELAADIDDAFENAGVESSLDRAIGPLGYGIGVQVNEFDKPAAEKAIEAINRATGGRLSPVIVNGKSAPGYVTILIGKRPR